MCICVCGWVGGGLGVLTPVLTDASFIIRLSWFACDDGRMQHSDVGFVGGTLHSTKTSEQ